MLAASYAQYAVRVLFLVTARSKTRFNSHLFLTLTHPSPPQIRSVFYESGSTHRLWFDDMKNIEISKIDLENCATYSIFEFTIGRLIILVLVQSGWLLVIVKFGIFIDSECALLSKVGDWLVIKNLRNYRRCHTATATNEPIKLIRNWRGTRLMLVVHMQMQFYHKSPLVSHLARKSQ